MKKLGYFIGCLLLTGCHPQSRNEVVKESYVHKYGVPVAKSDWEAQGKDGKVVQVRTDGVTVSKGYVNGLLEGETTYTFPNSSIIQFVENYQEGELGARRENYPSGVAMQEEQIEGNRLIKTNWYEDGTPAFVETYQDNLIVSGEYKSPLNVIESRVDEGTGVRILRSTTGEMTSRDTIRNGKMIERVTYFSNGDPQTVTPYENDKIHGTRLTYYQGGLPNTVEHWVYGVQDGITLVFQNGLKISEIPYLQGKRNGIELRFKDGNQLVEEVAWADDRLHGIRNIFVDEETKTEWYHQGDLVNRATFERLNMTR